MQVDHVGVEVEHLVVVRQQLRQQQAEVGLELEVAAQEQLALVLAHRGGDLEEAQAHVVAHDKVAEKSHVARREVLMQDDQVVVAVVGGVVHD